MTALMVGTVADQFATAEIIVPMRLEQH